MRNGTPIQLTSDRKTIEESQYLNSPSADPAVSRSNRSRAEGVSSPAWALQAQKQSFKTQKKIRQSAGSISSAQTKTSAILNETDYPHYNEAHAPSQYTMRAYQKAQIVSQEV